MVTLWIQETQDREMWCQEEAFSNIYVSERNINRVI